MGSRNKGFTLVELVVTVAIIGILLATAIPVYHTWQQRAYGSEAAVMLKQIINAEIAYYLDNDKFYPPPDSTISIYHSGPSKPSDAENDVEKNLHIKIPQGHFINYDLISEKGMFYVIITSQGNFNLFNGTPQVFASLDKDGKSEIVYAPKE